MQNERGAVLLIVLLIVALLSAILVDWSFSTLVDMRLTETFRDSNRAYYLARGGIEAGRQLLQNDGNAWDALNEDWAAGIPDYPLGEDASVTIRIFDEDGRFNLNRVVDGTGENVSPLYRDRLQRLLREVGSDDPEGLTDALVDWIDRNEVTSPRGAEDAWYRGLNPPGQVKNAPLDTVDELLLVRGWSPAIVEKITPFVTVAPTQKLNLNTAPAEVLRVWDAEVGDAVIEQLLSARAEAPFKSLDEARNVIGVADYSALNRNVDLAVASDYYRIRAGGRIGDGQRHVEALTQKSTRRQLWRRIE